MQKRKEYTKMKLKKYAGNPILKPNPENQWEERCVLNPAVIYDDKNEEFVMLYRAAGNDVRHQIKLGLATSKDGINFVRQSNKPAFEADHAEADGGCVEDPRLMKIGDMYYMTYAARAYAPGQYWLVEYIEGVSKAPTYMDETDVCGEELPAFAKSNITVSYLAATKDFKVFKKFGRITEATVDDRDVYLFPEKVNGKYAMTAENGVFVLQIVANKQVRLKVYNSVSDAWYGTECMAENCAVAYETDEHSNIVLSAGTYRIVFDQRTNRVTVENE